MAMSHQLWWGHESLWDLGTLTGFGRATGVCEGWSTPSGAGTAEGEGNNGPTSASIPGESPVSALPLLQMFKISGGISSHAV